MKKNIPIVLLFLGLIGSSTIHPMASKITQKISSSAFQKINRGATWFSNSLFLATCGAIIYLSCERFKADYLFTNVDPITKKFVQDTLLRNGFQESMVNATQIKFGKDYGAISIDEKFICVPQKLGEALSLNQLDIEHPEEKKIVENFVKTAESIIVHEGGHIKNNDSLRRIYTSGFIISNVLTFSYLGCNQVKNYFPRLNPGTSIIKNLLAAVTKVTIGLPIKLELTLFLNNMYCRRVEQQADNEVYERIKDPTSLEAYAEFFEKEEKQQQEIISEAPFLNKFPWLAAYLFDPGHPSAGSRAKNTRKAIEILKKENL